MVTHHGDLVFGKKPGSLHQDIMEGRRIREDIRTHVEIHLLDLMEQEDVILARGSLVEVQTIMTMMTDQETRPVMITFPVLVQVDILCLTQNQTERTETDILTEMVAVIQVLEIDLMDQVTMTPTMMMILCYD